MDLPSKQDNPANTPAKAVAGRERVPMSLPLQKMAVPEIPGFHLHWMRGEAQRIQQALAAGYTFVEQDEVDLSRIGIADNESSDGHTDLGSRVSIVSGKDDQGGAERAYLMKLPLEYWLADQAALEGRNEKVAATIRGDKGFSGTGSDENRYAPPKANRNIFQPKPSSRSS